MSLQNHLTHHQLSEVLIASAQETSPELDLFREHLRGCPACADKLISLRKPIALFRTTTTAWADQISASRSWAPMALPAATRPTYSRNLAGWMLAAALLLAAAIPIALHNHQSSTPARTATTASSQPSSLIGDEALLEEVDQTLSSPIPSPMQPLADPTAGRSSQIDSTPRKN